MRGNIRSLPLLEGVLILQRQWQELKVFLKALNLTELYIRIERGYTLFSKGTFHGSKSKSKSHNKKPCS
jgi:hypothetical protein